jgi:hypothetical protein
MNIASSSIVDGLPIPPLLMDLIQSGRWRQPSDAKVREIIPFLMEPVVFLESPKGASSVSVSALAIYPHTGVLRIARGSISPEADSLPWLDFEKALWLAINRYPGDDLGIVLDYRESIDDPRVLASDWQCDKTATVWREVATGFSQFANQLGIA